ncbi:hypothetical protein LCGC14_1003100 [marine sediment metagenome]|uniref:Uncharacterized protein n=1 Tax=marine sediment metagenome TaxID=412755 RepID=A0A0F9N2I6_9ZZZZ
MTQQLVSACCGAEAVDEITDGTGRCSRCKENAMFEPDAEEIASIKADMDYAEWKDAGKPGRIGA